MTALRDDAPASPLAQQPPSDQIAIVRNRSMSADCQAELAQTLSRGVMLLRPCCRTWISMRMGDSVETSSTRETSDGGMSCSGRNTGTERGMSLGASYAGRRVEGPRSCLFVDHGAAMIA